MAVSALRRAARYAGRRAPALHPVRCRMSKLTILIDGREIAAVDLTGPAPELVEPYERDRFLAIIRDAGPPGISTGALWRRRGFRPAIVDALIASGEVVAVKESRGGKPGARKTIYFAREAAQ